MITMRRLIILRLVQLEWECISKRAGDVFGEPCALSRPVIILMLPKELRKMVSNHSRRAQAGTNRGTKLTNCD